MKMFWRKQKRAPMIEWPEPANVPSAVFQSLIKSGEVCRLSFAIDSIQLVNGDLIFWSSENSETRLILTNSPRRFSLEGLVIDHD